MTIDLEILKTQYLQGDTSTQLDRLVANLTRIKVLTQEGTDEQRTYELIRESQFFIEWIVSNLNLESRLTLATELVELQCQLSQWKLHWSELWLSSDDQSQIAKLAQEWGDRVSRQTQF